MRGVSSAGPVDSVARGAPQCSATPCGWRRASVHHPQGEGAPSTKGEGAPSTGRGCAIHKRRGCATHTARVRHPQGVALQTRRVRRADHEHEIGGRPPGGPHGGLGGPPRFEVGDTMIHTPMSDLVVSSSPHLQVWGTPRHKCHAPWSARRTLHLPPTLRYSVSFGVSGEIFHGQFHSTEGV